MAVQAPVTIQVGGSAIPTSVRTHDFMLCQLASARDRLVLPLARAARLFHESRGWVPFGFAQPEDFTRERLGRSAAWLRRLASVDRAIEKHPALGGALTGSDGGPPIGTSALLEIARVSDVAPQDETSLGADRGGEAHVRAWIARARRLSLTAPSPGATPAPYRSSMRSAPKPPRAQFRSTCQRNPCGGPGQSQCNGAACTWMGKCTRSGSIPALRRAAATLRRFAAIERTLSPCTEPPSPGRLRQVAAQLQTLVELENTLEVRIGELLAHLDSQRPWQTLRFSSAAHYAEERLRMSRTTARDRIAVARGLRQLPAVERAYEWVVRVSKRRS